jgi:penicillin amidase
VSPHRFLKYINWLIAVVVTVFAGLVFWFVYRPVPKTSGSTGAPVSANVTIVRDALGVPHITASNIEDALFAQGFATAQDRLWQMDAARRLSTGTMAQVAGPAAAESDVESRRLQMAHIAERAAAQLPAEDKTALAAFARGVNHFIESNRGRLPVEFTLLGYDPQPWTVADSLAIFLQMHRTLTSKWKREMQKAALLATGDRAKVELLYPIRDGGEVQPGSNAWVVSGKLTASGKPLLANDPHLEFSIPSVWYMVHLKAPGLNVSGVSLVGTPGVFLGHNENIAWGATNLEFDVQDLYAETMDSRTGRYLYKGHEEQARLEREVIAVKGGKPVEAAIWVTRHGPVVAAEGARSYALKWTAAEPGGSFPVIALNRARNWTEFLAACEKLAGPAQNFVYADKDGNIGYHAVGRLPVRKNFTGDVPLDGNSGENEWDGFIPFDQMPSAFNPPSGMIVTANQNPFPEGFPYRVNGGFAPSYRSVQIGNLLRSQKQWNREAMLAVQCDVYSAFSHFLAKQLVAAYEKRGKGNPGLAPIAEILRNWNGQMVKGSAAPMIVTLTYQHFRKAVIDKASSGKLATYENSMAPSVLEKLLRSRPPSWFDDWDQVLLRALSGAIEEGKRGQGGDPSLWDYGDYNRLYLAHPVGGGIRWFGQYFNIGPIAMDGSSTTVKQTTQRLGPSMRMIADLANWDNSLQNIVTGESGHLFSTHYKDQWKAYYEGRGLPMQFDRVDGKDTLVLEAR